MFLNLWHFRPCSVSQCWCWCNNLFPSPTYLSPWLCLSSPTSCSVLHCPGAQHSPFPCPAALCTQSLSVGLSLLCNIQSGQSCWNSKLRKSRQAQVNVSTANSLLFLSISLILFHGLLLKCRSTSSHERKRSIFQHQEIKEIEWDNVLQTWKDLKIPLLLFL